MQIDRQEALFREKECKKIVGEAKEKLWEQTEDVRKLRAAMFLSNVLAERQTQIQEGKQSEEDVRDAERQFHDHIMARVKV